jgi:hypothetical protein
MKERKKATTKTGRKQRKRKKQINEERIEI